MCHRGKAALLHVTAYTPRPVGLLHDAFHRGQSAVSLTVSAQSLFRLRLWNKAHWGGVFSGRTTTPKTASHCDSTETGLVPSTACITTLFIVNSSTRGYSPSMVYAAPVHFPPVPCDNVGRLQLYFNAINSQAASLL